MSMSAELPNRKNLRLRGWHLLILSPFAEQIDAPSVRRAAWCNQYVLAHCSRMVVGHLTPGGMLACILSEAPADLEIAYLSSPPEDDL